FRCVFFFSSRRRHTRSKRDWSSDVCSSDLVAVVGSGVPSSGKIIKKPTDPSATAPPPPPAAQGPFSRDALFEIYRAELLGKDRRSEERRVGKESRTQETQAQLTKTLEIYIQ